MDFTWGFLVMFLVHCAPLKTASTNLVELTARAGENLTLWRGLNDSIHAFLICGKEVLFNCDHGSIIKIEHNIRADLNNGPIVIVDVQTEDSKNYTLQIINSQNTRTDTIFRLNVTEEQGFDHPQTTQLPSPANNQVYLAVGISGLIVLILVLVLVLAACWKMKCIPGNRNSVV